MKYARKPAQNFTPGDDQPETPCVGQWEVYDALIDRMGGPVYHAAKREAQEMCGACSLQPKCHAENAGEWWVQALAPLPVRPCEWCGTDIAISKHAPTRRYCGAACGIAARRKKAAA